MTDNELLFAISGIVKSQMDPLKTEIQDVKTTLEGEIQGVKTGLEGEIQDVKNDVMKIKITLENNVLPCLQSIESCYVDTYRRYADGIEQIDSIQEDVDTLKKVVTEHSETLQRIS